MLLSIIIIIALVSVQYPVLHYYRCCTKTGVIRYKALFMCRNGNLFCYARLQPPAFLKCYMYIGVVLLRVGLVCVMWLHV